MSTLDKTTRKRLFRKIRERKRKLLDRILYSIDEGIDIRFLIAAEQTGDESIVMMLIDHALLNGFDKDALSRLGYDRMLMMAVSEGFTISAMLITENFGGRGDYESLLEQDSKGRTAAEVAREKGMHKVADLIEWYLQQKSICDIINLIEYLRLKSICDIINLIEEHLRQR